MSADTSYLPFAPLNDAEFAVAEAAGDAGVALGDAQVRAITAAAALHVTNQNAQSLRAIAEHRLATAPDAVAHAKSEGINEAARLLERGLEDEEAPDGDA